VREPGRDHRMTSPRRSPHLSDCSTVQPGMKELEVRTLGVLFSATHPDSENIRQALEPAPLRFTGRQHRSELQGGRSRRPRISSHEYFVTDRRKRQCTGGRKNTPGDSTMIASFPRTQEDLVEIRALSGCPIADWAWFIGTNAVVLRHAFRTMFSLSESQRPLMLRSRTAFTNEASLALHFRITM